MIYFVALLVEICPCSQRILPPWSPAPGQSLLIHGPAKQPGVPLLQRGLIAAVISFSVAPVQVRAIQVSETEASIFYCGLSCIAVPSPVPVRCTVRWIDSPSSCTAALSGWGSLPPEFSLHWWGESRWDSSSSEYTPGSGRSPAMLKDDIIITLLSDFSFTWSLFKRSLQAIVQNLKMTNITGEDEKPPSHLDKSFRD